MLVKMANRHSLPAVAGMVAVFVVVGMVLVVQTAAVSAVVYFAVVPQLFPAYSILLPESSPNHYRLSFVRS